MILARRSSPAPSARHICRTQTKKTKSLTCLRHPLPSDSPRCRAVAAGGRGTKPRRGGIFRSLRTATMSLLTELDSFTLPFLQLCQSYGLRRLRATQNSNAKCPKRPAQNDFGTAFIPTGQPEITCVAADVSPLHPNTARKIMSRFTSAATINNRRSRGDETHFNLGLAIADCGFSIRDSSRRPLRILEWGARPSRSPFATSRCKHFPNASGEDAERCGRDARAPPKRPT
jgi:hypothetical protein